MDVIENQPIDVLAQKIHEDYVQKRLEEEEKKPRTERKTPDNDPSLYPWKKLDATIKTCDIEAMKNIPALLEQTGRSIYRMQTRGS
jgi:hypothetical protein